jgi:hypothetical protein
MHGRHRKREPPSNPGRARDVRENTEPEARRREIEIQRRMKGGESRILVNEIDADGRGTTRDEMSSTAYSESNENIDRDAFQGNK